MRFVPSAVTVLAVDPIGRGDTHDRGRCTTCESASLTLDAWQVSFRLHGHADELFQVIVCRRCARRIAVARQERE